MIKKDNKQRLFEVMGRLDKTFKPKLNEGFEEIEATDSLEAPIGTGEETQEPQEKTPEEKLEELTAKVDELYALLHGEEEEEVGEPQGLQEWNFDKKKGEDKEEKGEKKESGEKKWNFEKKEGKESLEHEEGESHEEEEKEHEEKKELDEVKPKIPVAAIAKVGK